MSPFCRVTWAERCGSAADVQRREAFQLRRFIFDLFDYWAWLVDLVVLPDLVSYDHYHQNLKDLNVVIERPREGPRPL